MKTEAHSPARTFSGWMVTGHGTKTVGCGSEAIGIAVRDPRRSGCQATGIAVTTAMCGSKAAGKIVILIRVMYRHPRHRQDRPRKWSYRTGHPSHMLKKFPLLPARTLSGYEAIGYGTIAGSGFMVTTSTVAMTGNGTKAVMSTALKDGFGLKAAGAD
jgi:hypothetical protein